MTECKKANHQANVVRLGEPRVHTNADTLEIFDFGGYQVVTKKGQFKAGDLAVYIQPDSVVPQTEAFKFIWLRDATPLGFTTPGPMPYAETPDRERRITVRKFRKEWSEGLLMPISDFPAVSGYYDSGHPDQPLPCVLVREGDDVSDILGITHWEGDPEVGNIGGDNDSRPKRTRPRTLKGWFYFILYKLGIKGARKALYEELAFDVPKFDVESFKNYNAALKEGERVVITEKIHGSQGRYFFK
jgi:hypothetical protein